MAQIFDASSPIIHAYMEGVRARQEEIAQQQRNVIQTEQLKQQKEQHEAQLKQAQEHFNATHALAKAMSDLKATEAKQNIQRSFLETGVAPPGSEVTQQPGETTTPQVPGTIPGSLQPFQAPGTQTLDIPGILHSAGLPNPEQYRTQQANLQRISQQPEIEKAGAIAGAEETAKLPGLLELETAKSAAKLREQTQQQQNQKELLTQRLASDTANKVLDRDARIQAANINASARRYAADHKSNTNIDPQELSDVATQVATGLTAVPTGANGIHIKSILSRSGMSEFTPKESDKLRNLTQLEGVFQKLRSFADENLSDSKIGAVGTAVASHIPMTDISNKLSQILIDAGPIARVYEGATGRYTMQQLQLAKDAMTSSKVTKGMALERVNTLEKEAKDKILKDILGRFGPEQQKLILKANGYEGSNLAGGKQLTLHYNDGTTEKIPDTPENRLKHGIK